MEITHNHVAALCASRFVLLGYGRERGFGVFLAEINSILLYRGQYSAHSKETLATFRQTLIVAGFCVENGRKVHLLDAVPVQNKGQVTSRTDGKGSLINAKSMMQIERA